MRKIILIIIFFLLSVGVYAQEDYKSLWTQADSLIKYKYYKSAFQVVDKIYKKAKVENKAGNMIKALIYSIQLRIEDEEEYILGAIERLESEILISEPPVKNILHSLLADAYWKYYTKNRSKVLDRSITKDSSNIKFWEIRKIITEIFRNYDLSLENPDLLKSVKTDFIQEAFIPKDTNRIDLSHLKPTLYDFLAFRAIDYFILEEINGLNFIDKSFSLDREELFYPAKDFVKQDFGNNYNISYKFKVIKLFQELTSYHLDDNNKDLIINIDLKRLEYAYINSEFIEKRELFANALLNLEKIYSQSPASILISSRLASYYCESNEENSKSLAHSICDNVIVKFPDNPLNIYCKNLIKDIEEKELQISINNITNLPGKPFLGYAEYKNISSLNFKIYKTNIEDLKEVNFGEKNDNEKFGRKLIKYFLKENPQTEFDLKFPEERDYMEHRAEIIFPPLPTGEYFIICGSSEDIDEVGGVFAYRYIAISRIGLSIRKNDNVSKEYFVFNSETGFPYKGVDTRIYLKEDYSEDDCKITLHKEFKTDSSGKFTIEPEITGKFHNIELRSGDDYLNMSNLSNDLDNYRDLECYWMPFDYEYQHKSGKSEKEEIKVYFFTDRKIYRPGQTVYFKGLVLKEKDGKESIASGVVNKIVFTRPFVDKEISRMYLTSNEYGSVNGSFRIPLTGINGNMKIISYDEELNYTGSVLFNVEEYKRPTFEVKFDKTKEEYRPGDSVTVKGSAVSYSGTGLDRANVKYTVKVSSYISNANYLYLGYNNISEQKISDGEVKTNPDGTFEIKFKSIEDKSVNVGETGYIYNITAEVTDINGETRENSASLNIKRVSTIIGLAVPENILTDNPSQIKLTFKNLNGEIIKSIAKIKIEKLKDDGKLYSRFFYADRYLYPEQEFNRNFPDERYYSRYNDNKISNSILFESTLICGDTSLTFEEFNSWEQGKYKISVTTKDKSGNEVNIHSYFNLINPDSQELHEKNLLWVYSEDKKYPPGENAEIIIGSSYKDVKVLYEIEKNKKIVHSEWITLNSGKKKINIPVSIEDIGGFNIHFFTVKNNLYETENLFIDVSTDKELKIEFENFSDIMKPGEEKELKIKIKGPGAEKAASELLISMYDASLDIFKKNEWSDVYEFSTYTGNLEERYFPCFSFKYFESLENEILKYKLPQYYYQKFFWFDDYFGSNTINYTNVLGRMIIVTTTRKGIDVEQSARIVERAGLINIKGGRTNENIIIVNGIETTNPLENIKELTTDKQDNVFNTTPLRKNFNETAFFYPELITNENGEITVKFTVPESLTKWKLLGFAHNKNLDFGYTKKDLVTRKDIMIYPNVPRFFRQNDTIYLNMKITNVSDTVISGNAVLMLFNSANMESLDSIAGNINNNRQFIVNSGQSTSVLFKIYIPVGIEMIKYRFIAGNESFSDGEENSVIVLSDRMLLTESVPFIQTDNSVRNINISNLSDNKSETLVNHNLTFEVASNPVWYIIQSTPYLIEYPYECSEQIFSRVFGNGFSLYLLDLYPNIKSIIEKWEKYEPDALLSNLEKNNELKSALLEETPWVLESKNETERKKRLALLLDLNNLSDEFDASVRKLYDIKNNDGGFPWFENMPSDRYITQYIMTGIGKMKRLSIPGMRDSRDILNMCVGASNYCLNKLKNDYNEILENEKTGLKKSTDDNLTFLQIQYLFMRDYHKDVNVKDSLLYEYFFGQARKYWQNKNIQQQAMIALILFRNGFIEDANSIIKSIKERAVVKEDIGIYFPMDFKDLTYSRKIEIQSLIIEAFDEITKDGESVASMRHWLLNQKRTKNWETTIATVSACFALLERNKDLLIYEPEIEIKSGDYIINNKQISDSLKEAGSGYFKSVLPVEKIKSESGNITISQKGIGTGWGAVHWQYFENIDKVKSSGSELTINKKIYKKQQTQDGEVLIPISESDVSVGDEIIVKLEINADRDYDYIHIKDYRASGMEPMNVLSKYESQGGLWYYMSTRDASTNYFITHLYKGSYTLEYRTRAFNPGSFSAGITTIQCMYAPEFNANSGGQRIVIK